MSCRPSPPPTATSRGSPATCPAAPTTPPCRHLAHPRRPARRRPYRADRQGLPRPRPHWQTIITPYKRRLKPQSRKDRQPCPRPTPRTPNAPTPLKTWRILRKLRCCPRRTGRLAKAIHVLQHAIPPEHERAQCPRLKMNAGRRLLIAGPPAKSCRMSTVTVPLLASTARDARRHKLWRHDTYDPCCVPCSATDSVGCATSTEEPWS